MVNPGDPESSRLIHAIRYDPGLVGMPPTGKLPDRQIEALTEWVRIGAPWPEQEAAAVTSAAMSEDRRKDHWAWKPLKKPDLPEIVNTDWPRGAIDRFILAKLEEKGITPGKDAGRYATLRRLTFDLTGLPPTPESIEAFANDSSATAPAGCSIRLSSASAGGVTGLIFPATPTRSGLAAASLRRTLGGTGISFTVSGKRRPTISDASV